MDAGGHASVLREPAASVAPKPLPGGSGYQEGPDFLYVATQGGQPPDPTLVPGIAAVVRRRRAALRRWAAGAREAQAGRPRGAPGSTSCGPAGRPAAHARAAHPPRRLLTCWNGGWIAAEFRRRDVWPLTHGQVDRVLARHGTHRPSYVWTPGPRYERAAANELWHIDLRQDRGVLAHAPGGGPRPPRARRSRWRRGGHHRLRRLPQRPPAPRRAGLADPGRAVRRHAIHRPRLRKCPVSRRRGRPTRRDPGRLYESHLHRGTHQAPVAAAAGDRAR